MIIPGKVLNLCLRKGKVEKSESQKGLVTLIKSKAPVKCAIKDAYGCFIQRGKCRRECHDSEKRLFYIQRATRSGNEHTSCERLKKKIQPDTTFSLRNFLSHGAPEPVINFQMLVSRMKSLILEKMSIRSASCTGKIISKGHWIRILAQKFRNCVTLGNDDADTLAQSKFPGQCCLKGKSTKSQTSGSHQDTEFCNLCELG
ncbi:Beta-defensin 133 [Manis javanica]|nr:Beta-defensin 133 [Manis javanica]